MYLENCEEEYMNQIDIYYFKRRKRRKRKTEKILRLIEKYQELNGFLNDSIKRN